MSIPGILTSSSKANTMNNITKSPIFISSKTVEKGSELKKEVLKFVDRLGESVSVAIQEIFTV